LLVKFAYWASNVGQTGFDHISQIALKNENPIKAIEVVELRG